MTRVRRAAYSALLAIAALAAVTGTGAIASAATAGTGHAVTAQAVSPSASPSASPHPSTTTTPAAPQPAGSPFPWDILITALSTLAGALGSVWLTDHLGAKRNRNAQLLERYAALTSSLDQLIRLIKHPETLNLSKLPPTVGAAIGVSVGAIQRSYSSVYLTAPKPIQSLAEQAWKAAWEIQLWLDGRSESPADELVQLVGTLDTASGDFAKAVRKEAK
jgi:hypothetical protein